MLDYEQWWSNWSLWFQGNQGKIPMTSVPKVSDYNLSTHAAGMAALVSANFKTNIYTGMWFLNDYTPTSKIWMQRYDTVISAYPYQPATRTQMAWQDLKKYYPKAPPIGVGNIVGHQFTGDRCKLPGVYEISAGREINPALDVSMFDTLYLQTLGVPVIPVATPSVTISTPGIIVPPPSDHIAAVNVNAVNVRSGPGSTYAIVGIKYLNNLVTIYETSNGYTRVGINAWIYAAYLTPR
jgi:hypothetical protein